MYYVENINGDGTKVRTAFKTYEDARDYQEWTAGRLFYADIYEMAKMTVTGGVA